MRPCPNCGAPVPAQRPYCPNCGAPQPAESGGGQGWRGGGLGCGLSALLLIGLGTLVNALGSAFPWAQNNFTILVGILYVALSLGVYFLIRARRPSLARGLGWGLLAGISLLVAVAGCMMLVFHSEHG